MSDEPQEQTDATVEPIAQRLLVAGLIGFVLGTAFACILTGCLLNAAWENEAVVRRFADWDRPQVYGFGDVKFRWKHVVNDDEVTSEPNIRITPYR